MYHLASLLLFSLSAFLQIDSLISVPLVHYCGSYWNINGANGLVVFQLDIENNSAQKVWQEVEFVFGKCALDVRVVHWYMSCNSYSELEMIAINMA